MKTLAYFGAVMAIAVAGGGTYSLFALYGDPVSFLCGAVTAVVVLVTTFVVLAMLSEG